VPLVRALRPLLAVAGIAIGPAVVATGARVALGDAIAGRLGAKAVLVLIGERPGLSSPDSLGAYLTFDPRPGCMDSGRNCVSNIRPEGLTVEAAAFKLAWLIGEAFRRKLTGVALKDESEALAASSQAPGLDQG
jgi:ethanolamine ammonia-lyase small subunit